MNDLDQRASELDRKAREWYAQHNRHGHEPWPLERIGWGIAVLVVILAAFSLIAATAGATSTVTGKWIVNYVRAGTVVAQVEGATAQAATDACIARIPRAQGTTTQTTGSTTHTCQTLRYTARETFAPNPVLGSATVTWAPVTRNTDGSAASITGYRVLYGTSQLALTQSVSAPATATSAVINGLAAGTWHFAVQAISETATTPESELSNVASKVIQ